MFEVVELQTETSGYPAHSVFSRQFTPAVQIDAGIRDRPVRRLRQSSSCRYTFFIGIGTSDSATVMAVLHDGEKTDPTNRIRRRHAALPKGHPICFPAQSTTLDLRFHPGVIGIEFTLEAVRGSVKGFQGVVELVLDVVLWGLRGPVPSKLLWTCSSAVISAKGHGWRAKRGGS